jgi:hypothetical protein
LFVLKEPGEDPTKYCKTDSLLDLYRQWNGAKFSFNYLGRVAYGLQNATKESYPTYETASIKENQDEAFLSTAFMNLKKTPTLDPKRWTNAMKLEEYVRKYPELIVEQVRITHADIVVCCGDVTHAFLKIAISLLPNKIDLGKMLFLSTCHPTARHWKDTKGCIQRKKAQGYKDLLEEYRTYL